MIDQLPSLSQLLRSLQQVPYLASKNLYRVAAHFLLQDDAKVEQFCRNIMQAKKNIAACPTCFVWKEKDRGCSFCDNAKRDKSLVCVVETWHELMAIEKTGGYAGVYHVLGGVISPLDGVGPEDLHIQQLVHRVAAGDIKEIILATNQTPEGEATAAYVAKKLADTGVTVSCLARGIPVGSSLDYMDRLTVHKALSERRPY